MANKSIENLLYCCFLTSAMVDYKGAIKRPFSDFKNLSIAALMYLVPFVNFVTSMTFGTGYTLKCAKTAKKKKLPEWKDWGGNIC